MTLKPEFSKSNSPAYTLEGENENDLKRVSFLNKLLYVLPPYEGETFKAKDYADTLKELETVSPDTTFGPKTLEAFDALVATVQKNTSVTITGDAQKSPVCYDMTVAALVALNKALEKEGSVSLKLTEAGAVSFKERSRIDSNYVGMQSSMQYAALGSFQMIPVKA